MRFGSPAVTTRGFREPEIREVAELIAQVLDHIQSEEVVNRGPPRGPRPDGPFSFVRLEAHARRVPIEAPMPRHIVIDVRRLGDFGIGTYIRNLVQALARLDKESRYTLVTLPKHAAELAGLGSQFPHGGVPPGGYGCHTKCRLSLLSSPS